jgi:hypothetical protein
VDDQPQRQCYAGSNDNNNNNNNNSRDAEHLVHEC